MTKENIITKKVISIFGITLSQLHTGDKSRKYFYTRCALANLLKEEGYSLHQIGEIVNRDHSTVAYYLRVHKLLIKQVDDYKDKYTECIGKLEYEDRFG